MTLISRFKSCWALALWMLALPVLANAEQGWTQGEKQILRSLSLSSLGEPPADPSNRYADDPKAAALGQQLFFDQRLSANGKLSCASCHLPDKFFVDQLPLAKGMGMTQRNTPTIVASAWGRWFYWDGRRDSLWAQALIPFEAPAEMGSSRSHVVWQVGQDPNYLKQYQALFGPFPSALKQKPSPLHKTPIGDAQARDQWYRLSNQQQHQISSVFANLGKAIAAYERTLMPSKTRFDRYVEQLFASSTQQAGSAPAKQAKVELSEQERMGIKLFIDPAKTQCMQCHNNPLLTNGGFHNVGSGNFYTGTLDFGRSLGVQAVLIDEFNCLGPYSDAERKDCQQLRFLDATHAEDGAFKTPSLRNLGMTAPYFHDGRFNTLREVVDFYNEPPSNNGPHELRALELSEQELEALVAFLEMLNEDIKP